jgi:4a-hydroxytetrahydrobiopterin dehydratase
MSDAVPEGWTLVERPPGLFRRFAFTAYRDTRAYLDALAKLSDRTGLHPNLSFASTYVNVTVPAADGKAVGEAERLFAAEASALANPPPAGS